MSDPFLAEIKLVSFVFAPRGWALCNGQLLPIAQNQALFALLGTTYGGDGRVTFALPDLRGRVPIHVANGFTLGQRGGETAHALTLAEMPQHGHAVQASANVASTGNPSGARWAVTAGGTFAPIPDTGMAGGNVTTTGGGQAHENRSPYLVVSFIIALQGIFPSQT